MMNNDLVWRALQRSKQLCGRKQKAEETEPSTKPDKIDKLAHDLYQKQGEAYSMPQFRLWARMLLNKQYKKAPPYPPFEEKTPKTRMQDNSLSNALTHLCRYSCSWTTAWRFWGNKYCHVSRETRPCLWLPRTEVLCADEFDEQKKVCVG